MKGIKNLLFLILCTFSTAASAQYITVDDNKTAQELVENVLVKSSCAFVSNFNATGDNFTAGQKSFAYFNKGTSNFPFSEGVIISTTKSKNATVPYIPNDIDTNNDSDLWLGDPDLNQTLGITTSINATVLEFDFVPLTTSINFNYIFASNEYRRDFSCLYSDAFAFLIKEKGTTDNYKNIAVIPNSQTPVSSKNVHPNIIDDPTTPVPREGCPPANENYFQGYNTGASPINFSGQTKIMNAHTDVVIGKTYHIKLVIADDQGERFSSAIFLEAGSFTAKVDLGSDRTLAGNNPICYGDSFPIDTKLPVTYGYEWYKDGSTTPIPGQTSPSLTVTSAGTYKVKVTLAPNCTVEDEIKIEYAPEIPTSNSILVQCDDDSDGIAVFDLYNGFWGVGGGYSIFESLTDAQQNNSIPNPHNYQNKTQNQIVYVDNINQYGCVAYGTFTLHVSNNTISPQNPIQSCDTDASQDGITQFDLNTQVTPQVVNGLPPGLTVEYYLNQTDAIAQKNQLPNLFTNTIPNQQIIYARIVNGPDCYKITPETLVVSIFNPANFQDETAGICDGSSTTLTVDSGFSSYLWSNGSTTNTTTVTAPGEYTVTVTNTAGCQKTKKYSVKPSGVGTITGVTVSDFAGNENSVSISYSGNGDYEFSLDGNVYQDSPVFNGLRAGTYWATTNDKNGCGFSAPYQFYVLDYPRFFTPNNDGYNDIWEIKNLDLLPKSSITVFDRYGKLLKQLNESNMGWNGTFLGRELPSDDYWFVLTFEDGKIIKGHFSLIR